MKTGRWISVAVCANIERPLVIEYRRVSHSSGRGISAGCKSRMCSGIVDCEFIWQFCHVAVYKGLHRAFFGFWFPKLLLCVNVMRKLQRSYFSNCANPWSEELTFGTFVSMTPSQVCAWVVVISVCWDIGFMAESHKPALHCVPNLVTHSSMIRQMASANSVEADRNNCANAWTSDMNTLIITSSEKLQYYNSIVTYNTRYNALH